MQTDSKLFSMFYKILLDFSNLSTYFTDVINETNNRRGETMLIRTIIDGVATEKNVKNLGWLLKNWQRIHSFTFDKTQETPLTDGKLTVTLFLNGSRIASNNNKVEAITDFASETVLWEMFLRRPIFYGLPVTTIDNDATYRTQIICK